MGKLGKALLHSTLLVVVLASVAIFYLDRIVATAVEKGGSQALGVETAVDGVSLGLLRGKVGLSGLSIANPEGFEGPTFLELGSIRVEAPPRALLGDPVVIPSIALEDIVLSLEGSTQGTNYGRLLRNIDAGGGSGKASGADAGGSSDGRKFVVRELVVRNVRANLELAGMGAKLASTSVEIPEIRLTDLGSGSSGGLELSQLIGRVTREVVQSVVRERPELKAALGRELRGRIEGGAREGLERLREGLLPRER